MKHTTEWEELFKQLLAASLAGRRCSLEGLSIQVLLEKTEEITNRTMKIIEHRRQQSEAQAGQYR